MQTEVLPSIVAMSEYARELERSGHRVIMDSSGGCWREGEVGSLIRIPTFDTSPPDPREVRRLLIDGRAAVGSYLVEPDANHPPNALLYLCRDRSYSVDKLPKTVRSNIRKASKFLRFSWLDRDTVLNYGFPAFRDAKLRNNLSDGTPEAFRVRLDRWLDNPAHHVLGAWKDDALIAFLRVTAVDDWVEFGAYSANAGLEFRPNNGLIHTLVSHFLTERNFRTVNYGLSSVQEESNAATLHQFKLKIGFEAIPVHRMFVMNPFLRPFANRLSLAVGHGLLKMAPGSRVLKKGVGVLARLVGVDKSE